MEIQFLLKSFDLFQNFICFLWNFWYQFWQLQTLSQQVVILVLGLRGGDQFSYLLKVPQLLFHFFGGFTFLIFQKAKVHIQSGQPVFAVEVSFQVRSLSLEVVGSENKLELPPEVLVFLEWDVTYISRCLHCSSWFRTEAIYCKRSISASSGLRK